MPARIEHHSEHGVVVRQIVACSHDGDFLDHLIEGMRSTSHIDLYHALDKLSNERDADIERMCNNNHQEFVNSVNKLDHSRVECIGLGTEILSLEESYQTSTDNLAVEKKNVVDSRSVRQNIDESSDALKECLEALRLSNQVHELVGKQNHYAALRALDELQTLLRTQERSGFKIGDMIDRSIPATQKMIAEAVMTDLNTWLYHIRDVSQYIGEVAFYHTEQKRSRQKERAARDVYLATFKLNSAIELVADETEEYDVLNDEEAQVQVDFTPLFECIHIHDALGESERFRAEYAVTRRRQKDLIIPSTLSVNDDEASDLKTLLESIAGFAIVERATIQRTEDLRTPADVDELWDSMSHSITTLMSGAVASVENADTLLRITGVISLFIQTMESFGFHAVALNAFLMTLFEKYTFLLKRRCSDDFQEIVSTDDYMPMPINDVEAYDRIIEVGWYVPDKERDDIVFPCVLPFSQMYPMCCIDIRNFLNQTYTAPDDYLSRSSAIDETIRKSIDELLTERICLPLIERLSSQYPGQIVQILTNFEHFEKACHGLQTELAQAQTSRSRNGQVTLGATAEFTKARQKARDRIFELVNSKIDDLIETAEYDWTSTMIAKEPSGYMTELTRYLSNIMSSVLLGLPAEIKDMIYFEALSHAADNILKIPLDPSVSMISQACLHLLSLDVMHLSSFISMLSLPTPNTPSTSMSNAEKDPSILRRTVDELVQTLELMRSDNPEQFFDIAQRNRKYAAVNAQTGAVLIEKVERGRAISAVSSDAVALNKDHDQARGNTSERFGNYMRGLRRAAEGERGS
ncbi:MAG: hypothetical protein M1828_006368 [Chrysothrix sp. TS-e1954]|nr:MAG: hypothetical protein M1828_006368 [Chrysothrix sp. TS-e1954]